MSLEKHRQDARRDIRVAIITVSDSRTLETDRSGAEMETLLRGAGHEVAGREVVPDDRGAIAAALRRRLADRSVEAVLLDGGTGISVRDGTVEVVRGFLDREIPGFGELFRQLSYQEIGSAAMLSRAVAGVVRGKAVFSLPGSTNAVRLAMTHLILPELGHILAEVNR